MSTCQCSMAISMVGDGCRYCQPQTYIEQPLETLEGARAAPVSEAAIDSLVDELRIDAEALGLSVEVVRVDMSVSEAKAQGVVKWPEADEIMQMAFEEGQPADDASGYCFELEEFDLFIERLMSDVARLNAAPVQQVVPDASTKMQWPEIVALVNEVLGCEAHKYPCERGSIGHEMTGINFNSLARIIDRVRYAAAPAAPAADAGLDYQVLFDAIAAATSVYANGAVNISVQAFRDALAAHRAKGVA